MMIPRLPRLAALLGALALLAGCAKTDPASAEAAHGRRPQVLRYGNTNEPQDIDPQVVQGTPEDHVIKALFEGLLTADPKDLHPIPGLARSWEVSRDGLTYTFHLRENLRWSDGSPITTDDFLLSWKRMISPRLADDLQVSTPTLVPPAGCASADVVSANVASAAVTAMPKNM